MTDDETLWNSFTFASNYASLSESKSWTTSNRKIIVPALQSMVSSYLYNNSTYSGDMICAFYAPNSLPNGWVMSQTAYQTGDYLFYYYIWMYNNNSTQSRFYWNYCSSNSCNYEKYTSSDYSNQFFSKRSYPRRTFFQKRLTIAYGNDFSVNEDWKKTFVKLKI